MSEPQELSKKDIMAFVQQNPKFAEINAIMKSFGVNLFDNKETGTVPEKPTPSATLATNTALDGAKVAQDAIKAQAPKPDLPAMA